MTSREGTRWVSGLQSSSPLRVDPHSPRVPRASRLQHPLPLQQTSQSQEERPRPSSVRLSSTLAEPLLCPRHCAGPWGHTSELLNTLEQGSAIRRGRRQDRWAWTPQGRRGKGGRSPALPSSLEESWPHWGGNRFRVSGVGGACRWDQELGQWHSERSSPGRVWGAPGSALSGQAGSTAARRQLPADSAEETELQQVRSGPGPFAQGPGP